MSVPVGPSKIMFRGRLIERHHKWVALKDIACPDFHRVRLGGVFVREDVGLTCAHKEHGGAKECGALLWLLHLPLAPSGPRFYFADVTYEELIQWEREHYSVEDILRYLGAWSTRGDLRRGRAVQQRSA